MPLSLTARSRGPPLWRRVGFAWSQIAKPELTNLQVISQPPFRKTQMSADRTHIVEVSPNSRSSLRTRSRVTNHKDLLPGLDGRTGAARRFRDLVNSYIADMGGLDRCSEIKLGLLRRLAATTVQAEMLEARMVNGEAIDISQLCTLASTTVRISQRLGLERRTRDVTPPLPLDYARDGGAA